MSNKIELDIFMVAYKRPTVLQYTLENLLKNLTPSEKLNINLYCWANSTTDEDVWAWNDTTIDIPDYFGNHMFFRSEENRGKGFALNEMFDKVSNPDHYVMNLDQDMVFTAPFVPILEDAVDLRFDILGFASNQFWAHIPAQDEVSHFPWRNYEIYYSTFIAGGMMLLPGSFLAEYKWTNEDGVYGGDDYNMCHNTTDKFILESKTDWLIHDPLARTTPELEQYHKNKRFYLDQGLYVLPHNWNDK